MKNNKNVKYSTRLPGAEFSAVKIRFTDVDASDGDRLARLCFHTYGVDVKLWMMESDLRHLARFINSVLRNQSED